ncbi:hypothetical protein ANANG_G00013950 [Anguilla anguilla]|uniref:RRM domain-containing protein n=2 Tax=Anguilla anguilla TaxID=7936 RepID=A0A9D3SA21_ANGAN|nr:hypothetical protein ANANG_G00013950 [Anguilla anguilla]
MAVVVRLLGLNIEAGSEDIRRFFDGIHIPGGGVYITGGSRGEAFIIFATEKDSQLAMERSGSLLRGTPILLSLSSEEELHHKMASRFKKHKSSKRASEKKAKELTEARAPDPATQLLLSLFTAIGGLQGKQLGLNIASQPLKNMESKPVHITTFQEQLTRKRATSRRNTRYLRLYGLPKSITRQEINHFFKGLHVEDVIVNVRIGRSYGCLVKFAKEQDALEGLKFTHQSMGSFSVEVKEASMEMWVSALECKKSLKECQTNEYSTPVKRYPEGRSRSRSPKRHRSYAHPPSNEFCVKIGNISPRTSKTEIKEFFGCSYIKNDKVLHLLDQQGYRTSTAFIIFDNLKDYHFALNLNGSQFLGHTVKVSAVTRENMEKMITASRWNSVTEVDKGRFEAPRPEKARERFHSLRTCMYVRNLPADVRKVEVKDFFYKFRVSEDHINLLYDRQGVGIGEALVKFKSEDVAKMAENLNGNIHLGANVLLTRITLQQMEDLLHMRH